MFRISHLARACPPGTAAFYARFYTSSAGKESTSNEGKPSSDAKDSQAQPDWGKRVWRDIKDQWSQPDWRKRVWSDIKDQWSQPDWRKRVWSNIKDRWALPDLRKRVWSGFKDLMNTTYSFKAGTLGAYFLAVLTFGAKKYWDERQTNKKLQKVYDLAKAGLTEERGKIEAHKSTLNSRAYDKAGIQDQLNKTLSPNIASTSRNEEITRLQNLNVPLLMVVEGMKGVGKTCTLLKLCEQQIVKKGQPALFLSFKDNARTEVENILVTDEVAFLEFVNECKTPLTLVVDDLNLYLQENAETGKRLVTLFWTLVQSGVKVILSCSEYGLVGRMHAFPGLHNIRCYQHRFKAPKEEALTQWINDALAAKQQGTKDGNSSQDVAYYCEGVGTLRDFANGLEKGLTVRQVSESVFERETLAFQKHLTALLYDPEQVEAKKQLLKVEGLLHLGVASTEERALLRKCLKHLCDHQFVTAESVDELSLCEKLTQHNVIRPISAMQETLFFEFHSFASEVAVRALLEEPLVKSHPNPLTESQGRGSQALINYLSEGPGSNLTASKKTVNGLLLKLSKPEPDPQSPK